MESADNENLTNEPAEPVGVLAEIDKLHQKKPGLGSLLTLGVSIALFFGLGAAAWSWKFALLLIPILLFHELGHYVAMRHFKYRNLRMFFIPLMGAAVSGRNYNVPGWKKAVVSLMGPVPGIVLGAILGIVALITKQELLLEAATLTMFLNGFNLLPFLPLDGGWVAHSILFSRHYMADFGFRLVAALVLAGLGLLLGAWLLLGLGVLMLIALPASLRIARITSELREQGVSADSTDDQTIPKEIACDIIGRIRAVFPESLNDVNTARFTMQIFENLNARPPGVLATLAFGGLHAASFFASLFFVLVFTVGQQMELGELMRAATVRPGYVVECGSILNFSAADVDVDGTEKDTIIATLTTRDKAETMYERIAAEMPANSAVTLIGRTALLTIPADDDEARKTWLARLKPVAPNLFVDDDQTTARFTLSCIAQTPTEAEAIESEVLQYFGTAGMHLIPPWSDTHTVSEEQHKSRRTYQQLGVDNRYLDSRAVALRTEIRRASKRGDQAEVEGLRLEHTKMMRRLQLERLDELRKRGEAEVDVGLIDLFATKPENAPADVQPDDGAIQDVAKKLAAWRVQMGARMGQLPLVDSKPPQRENRHSVQGTVTRNGPLLNFQWILFESPPDGATALIDWLCEKQCIDVRCRFYSL